MPPSPEYTRPLSVLALAGAEQKIRTSARCKTWPIGAASPAVSRCHDSTRWPEMGRHRRASKETRATLVRRSEKSLPLVWIGPPRLLERTSTAASRSSISSLPETKLHGMPLLAYPFPFRTPGFTCASAADLASLSAHRVSRRKPATPSAPGKRTLTRGPTPARREKEADTARGLLPDPGAAGSGARFGV